MQKPAGNPRDDDLEVFGLTHPGKVRENNEDHFLLCSLFKRLKIHATSLPKPETLRFRGERVSFMALVADGVGGALAGEEASRLALETIARYITQGMDCYYAHDPDQEILFHEHLQRSVMECHDTVISEGHGDPHLSGMATTLTLAIGHWPWAYVVQVGDSRAYHLHDGALTQITRDQTAAQFLADRGMLPTSEHERTRLENMLASAIGGPTATPVTSRIALHLDDVILLCSDGLTRHVPDHQIRDRLDAMVSAKETCEELLADALDAGGEDNITVIAGRVTSR